MTRLELLYEEWKCNLDEKVRRDEPYHLVRSKKVLDIPEIDLSLSPETERFLELKTQIFGLEAILRGIEETFNKK